MDAGNLTSYSANVRISLAVNGRIFSVAELGPGFVVLRDAIDHPPALGMISMSIDDVKSEWPVDLIEGIAAGTRDTLIVSQQTRLNGSKSQ